MLLEIGLNIDGVKKSVYKAFVYFNVQHLFSFVFKLSVINDY